MLNNITLFATMLFAQFYTGGDYPTGITGDPFSNRLFTQGRSLLTVVAGLAVIYMGATMVMSSDDRVISRCRTWMFAIIVAVALSYIVPGMLDSIFSG